MQAEIAKELLNNNDATTIGVLLGAIVILLTFIGFLWRQTKEDAAYIRSQDKANLEMLSSLAKHSEALGVDVSHIKDYTNKTTPKVDVLLDIIKKRLDK